MFHESARIYDALYEGIGKDYAAESAEIDELIQHHRPGAETLLDVACGTGGHVRELKGRYRCSGVELAPEMVAIARERNPDLDIVEADMRTFDLARDFDAVVCLFSSIGYMTTIADLRLAVANMARHVAPGGVLAVEAWFEPDAWKVGRVSTEVVETGELSIVRMNASERSGRVSIMNFHHLVGTASGVDHIPERHEMGLFTRAEYEATFAAAGLHVTRDPDALLGRGLYVGTP